MTGQPSCDQGLYDVTILAPVVYRIRAVDERQARLAAAKLWMQKEQPLTAGFPESVTVQEVGVIDAST